MEALPYFLNLLKNNFIIYSIITSRSISESDLRQVNHITHSESAIELIDFSLSKEEKFSSVDILIVDETVTINFHVNTSEYLIHPEYYFGRNGVQQISYPYIVFGIEAQTQKLNLGSFNFLGPNFPSATVQIRQSSVYGNVVSVNFYKFNQPRLSTEE